MDKEALISEIQQLTKRIGQAARSGVTELVERLRILRTRLATDLARRFDAWLLINNEGKTEFVDRPTFERRVRHWKERRRASPQAPTAVVDERVPSSEGASSAPRPEDPVRAFFGEPIYVYTRRQALEDGVLVDVSSRAAGCFRHPTAMTTALWALLVDVPAGPGAAGAVEERAREVLRAAAQTAVESPRPGSQVAFQIILGTSQGLKTLDLLACCGPGDHGETVITIGFPSDF